MKTGWATSRSDYSRPESNSLGVEFCGTSITSRAAAADNFAALLAENPHFVFADNTRKGYGLVDFTPKQLTTTLRVVDDVTRRDTRVETLARFAVQAGRQVIEAA
jgi:alkaline phosphatase D